MTQLLLEAVMTLFSVMVEMTLLILEPEMTLLPVELVMTPLMVDSEQISQSSLGIKEIIRLKKFHMPNIESRIIKGQMVLIPLPI